MKQHSKLSSQEKQQIDVSQQTHPEAGREFASVDEMLRHDALHTPVPPAIGHRLQQSLAGAPPTARPWWRRLLGS
jgi:hypothetical protein